MNLLKSFCGINGLMNWTTANNWASNLVHGGFSDWRLPTASATLMNGAAGRVHAYARDSGAGSKAPALPPPQAGCRGTACRT
jgi:hypothetical protein